jgi:hypothetical protein
MGTNPTEREQGITILGLIVVVGATMLVVGAVTFGLSSRHAVGDESAKHAAEAAAFAASMHEAETGKVPTAAELAEYEPSLEYESLEVGDEVAVQGKVYVRSHGDVAELAARSGDTCFWVQRSPVTTKYAKGACDGDPGSLTFRDSW